MRVIMSPWTSCKPSLERKTILNAHVKRHHVFTLTLDDKLFLAPLEDPKARTAATTMMLTELILFVERTRYWNRHWYVDPSLFAFVLLLNPV